MHTAQLVAARYRLEEHLASGGMGEVWTAVDQLSERRVALKLLHPSLAADDAFRRRFRAEAAAVGRLSHPGVVAVFDYGEDDDVTYLAMELVVGEALSEVLHRRTTLTPSETADLVAQSAEALGAAHALGLVHRDVKPGNLLLRTDGRVKVTDFGIVRATDTTTLTREGTVLGTVGYMSPEQVRGARVTAASDIYSLGVVAYECLTGMRPYAADDSIAVALAHLHAPVPELPPSVPAGMRALVTAMLQKDPAARPASATLVAQRARALAAGGRLPQTAPYGAGALPLAAPRAPATGAPTLVRAPTEALVRAPTEVLVTTARPDALETKPLAGVARARATSAMPPVPVRAATARPSRHMAVVAVVALASLLGALLVATVSTGRGTSPGAGTQGQVTVPALVGTAARTAALRLARLGLRASFPGKDPAPHDTVTAEHPGAGSSVRRGTTVHLGISATGATSPSTAAPSTTSTTTSTTAPIATSTQPSAPTPTAPPPNPAPGPAPGGPGPGPGHTAPGGPGAPGP